MTTLDPGLAAFVLVWGAPFFVAGLLGAWRAALAMAALPAASAGWGLLDAFALGTRGVERALRVDAALTVLLVCATCAATYAAGRWRRPRGDREAA